jgi:hypothetical protein
LEKQPHIGCLALKSPPAIKELPRELKINVVFLTDGITRRVVNRGYFKGALLILIEIFVAWIDVFW